MPLISGPSRDIVFGWAHDFAEVAIEIHRLPDAEQSEQEAALAKLRAEGAPASLQELVELAASTLLRNRLGWFRRNQFFGALQAFCILQGMPKPDAGYLVGLIRARIRQESGR